MTLETKVKLPLSPDLNRVLDLCGHFSRVNGDDAQYQKLVPYMVEAVTELVQRGFDAGREFERRNPPA